MSHQLINIRSTRAEDLAPLTQIYVTLYDTLDIGERWTLATAQRMLEYYFGNYPKLAFSAEYDGRLVGAFLSAAKPWWDGYHLFDGEIFVALDHQRYGIGRQLLQAVFTAAQEQYQAVCWDFFTLTGKHSPVPWYQKIGIDVPDGYVMMSGPLDAALERLTAVKKS